MTPRRSMRLALILPLVVAIAGAQDSRADALKAAREAITARDFARAIEGLTEALERAPADVEIDLALAEAMLEADDVGAARRHADRAAANAPSDPRGAILAGHVLFRMGAIGEERSGPRGLLVGATFADAATMYEDAERLGADPYQAAFWAAEAHERARATDRALAAVDRALAARPDEPAALAARGRLLLAASRPRDALAVFERVIALAPKSDAAADAAFGVIQSLLALRDVAGVSAAFPRLVRGDPHRAALRIHDAIATAWRDPALLQAWDELLEASARDGPPLAITPYYRAELAIRRGRPDAALRFIDAYLASVPDDSSARLMRAVALRKLGRLAEARVALGKSYDRDPDSAGALDEFRFLVGAFYAARQFREAAEVQEFVVHKSGAARDRHDLAVLLLDSGAPADAGRLYREIAADREAGAFERARAMNALALLERSQGRTGEAEALFRKALDEDPDSIDARENLGLLLIEAGKIEAGRAELLACNARDPDPARNRKRTLYHLLRLAEPALR